MLTESVTAFLRSLSAYSQQAQDEKVEKKRQWPAAAQYTAPFCAARKGKRCIRPLSLGRGCLAC
jgi:hypothetical protein